MGKLLVLGEAVVPSYDFSTLDLSAIGTYFTGALGATAAIVITIKGIKKGWGFLMSQLGRA